MLKYKSSPRCLFLMTNIAIIFACSLIWTTQSTYAQSTLATLSGIVEDENGSVVPNAEITVLNPGTAQQRKTTTNSEGYFTITFLPPASYTVTAKREGFAPLEIKTIVLNVSDQREIKIRLKVAAVGESVNVIDGTPIRMDTSVGTVVDRQFVENLPLNGRSFQSLITLAPGVVLTKSSFGEQGQFSVNGQRANSNYFTVDGVSANIGVTPILIGQSVSGALPGLTASGGTNNLVSVDALQEFKLLTSTYAPEFGRMPGGQVQILTRSGTNEFHGSLFNYFRNDVLDANDWFANAKQLNKPALRQNNFGGVFGGPIILPRFGEGGTKSLYNGRNRTFFFLSYEGLRLRLPQVRNATVPSIAARQGAPAQMQPYLKAYPIPNGRVFTGATGIPTGLAEFSASFSDPSTLNATSIRIDQVINNNLTLFGRYNHAPSESTQRLNGLSELDSTKYSTKTLTLGMTHIITPNLNNELRVNYSYADGSVLAWLDSFGGATPLSDSQVFPPSVPRQSSRFIIQILGAQPIKLGESGKNSQRQINLVDNFSVTARTHQLKFGADYRRLTPIAGGYPWNFNASFRGVGMTAQGGVAPVGSVFSGSPSSIYIFANEEIHHLLRNFSAYGQDTWRANDKLTLTYGIRWEVNPAPTGQKEKPLYTLVLPGDPATTILSPAGAQLASAGTPLYRTTYNNFAPRIGASYQFLRGRGHEGVLRGGFGIFYDLGNNAGLNANSNFPYSRYKALPSRTLFPVVDPILIQPPPVDPTISRPISVYDPNLKLPRVYQWNVALELSLGANQTISTSYVGATGRRLLRTEDFYNPSNAAFFQTVGLIGNSATSDYHSMQLQLSRRLSSGLQALASYAWSKSLDIASTDSAPLQPGVKLDPRMDRGPSDFDIRHALSGAVTYNIRIPEMNAVGNAILHNWAVDAIFTARSATPVDIFFTTRTSFAYNAIPLRPDLVLGVPIYLKDQSIAGGRSINPAAFAIPTSERQGTLGRNALRGFPVHQIDLALRRQFRIAERVGVQFRVEAFNLFNHPNFAAPNSELGEKDGSDFFSNPLFGRSAQMFGKGLGSGGSNGGLNPLYQVGGPRSIQLALRFQL